WNLHGGRRLDGHLDRYLERQSNGDDLLSDADRRRRAKLGANVHYLYGGLQWRLASLGTGLYDGELSACWAWEFVPCRIGDKRSESRFGVDLQRLHFQRELA